jgi:predicted phosphodiesterase
VKKSYFSKFEEAETVTYPFRALRKTENIHLYHVADVHCRFEDGIAAATYFGEDLDVLVVNGDIAEVNKESDFTNVAKFMGAIAKGCVPVIFVRGNHDTRGKLASEYSKYYPTENENTYFTFDLGGIAGIALDCGEDKYDDNPEYGGTNRFEPFRRRETEFLKNLDGFGDKIVFAVSHVCPVRTIPDGNPLFDIERDVYSEWNRELGRLGIKFMLTGHTHKVELIPPNGGLLPHNYPLVVGSECQKDGHFLGAALVLNPHSAKVVFNDGEHRVIKTHELSY